MLKRHAKAVEAATEPKPPAPVEEPQETFNDEGVLEDLYDVEGDHFTAQQSVNSRRTGGRGIGSQGSSPPASPALPRGVGRRVCWSSWIEAEAKDRILRPNLLD